MLPALAQAFAQIPARTLPTKRSPASSEQACKVRAGHTAQNQRYLSRLGFGRSNRSAMGFRRFDTGLFRYNRIMIFGGRLPPPTAPPHGGILLPTHPANYEGLHPSNCPRKKAVTSISQSIQSIFLRDDVMKAFYLVVKLYSCMLML